MKPLIQSSSEAPFACFRLPTLHHLSARCYPRQATPLHHRWRMSICLYVRSIQELDGRCKKRAVIRCPASPPGGHPGGGAEQPSCRRIILPLYVPRAKVVSSNVWIVSRIWFLRIVTDIQTFLLV